MDLSRLPSRQCINTKVKIFCTFCVNLSARIWATDCICLCVTECMCTCVSVWEKGAWRQRDRRVVPKNIFMPLHGSSLQIWLLTVLDHSCFGSDADKMLNRNTVEARIQQRSSTSPRSPLYLLSTSKWNVARRQYASQTRFKTLWVKSDKSSLCCFHVISQLCLCPHRGTAAYTLFCLT